MTKTRLIGGAAGVILTILIARGQGPGGEASKPQMVLETDAAVVGGVAFSPDGKTLAAACDNGTVELWEVRTGQRRAILRGHRKSATCVAFSRDGKVLASGGEDGTIRLWDTATDRLETTIRADIDSVGCVAFRGDGKLLASAGDDKAVKLWDVDTGKRGAGACRVAHRLNGHRDGKPVLFGDTIMGVAFRGDGKLLASAGGDGTIRLWDVDAARLKATLVGSSERPASAVAFSPAGTLLASGDYEGRVKLWRVGTCKVVNVFKLGGCDGVAAVAFSPDGKLLAAVAGEGMGDEEWEEGPDSGFDLKLWDVATGRQRAHVSDRTGQMLCAAFSPDGKMLATGDCDDLTSPRHGRIRLWDVAALLNGRR